MGLTADNEAIEEEQFDPDIAKALTMLGLCASEEDVSSTVTETVTADDTDEDSPDPYAQDEPGQLVKRQEPKPKEIYIDGKKWWDITDVLGNSEEIIALHTVPDTKRKQKGKMPKKNADGVLTRADR